MRADHDVLMRVARSILLPVEEVMNVQLSQAMSQVKASSKRAERCHVACRPQ